MSCRFESILALPSWEHPNVAAVAVDSDGALEALAARLQGRLMEDFGWPDKPFRAHLTVLRVRRPRRSDLATAQTHLSTVSLADLPAFPIEGMHLYRSDLMPGGPRYTALCNLPFGRS